MNFANCGKGMLILLLFASNNLTAQVLPDSTVARIDKMFAKWNTTSDPGYAIGIVRNDSLIYSKGFGMANLEYAVPNSPATIYHMASISKQFTAYCILLLAKQGKLKLDDDVRKYLTWFPNLKQKITIRHLLNHTSGIRDQWVLVSMSGTGSEDVITQDHIIRLLSRQQRLNFTPGEEYSYSNSNFTMLAEIVKSISGKSFRQFADSAIFKPLGMTNTHVHDDHSEIVANRAYSYRFAASAGKSSGSGFVNAVLSYANSGATSLFTNIPDMSKWIMNFYQPKIGDKTILAELTHKGVLNNGNTIPYASGILVDEYKGLVQYSHGGADAGYRTYMTVFPSQKMGFIVYSNFAEGNPGAKAYELVDEVLKGVLGKNSPASQKKLDSSLAVLKDTTSLTDFTGDYVSHDGVKFSFNIKDQKLFWKSQVSTYLLARTFKDTFSTYNDPASKFVFTKGKDGKVSVDQYWPNNHRLLNKYNSVNLGEKEMDKALQEYEGVYYSSEVDMKYTLRLQNHQVMLSDNKPPDASLTYIHKDFLSIPGNVFHFKRNSQNQIIGFEVSNARVRHMAFNKIQ